jgi:hypothetical protein
MADVRSRLASVFGGNTGGAGQGNDPLRYQPPKEPPRGAQSQAQAAQPAAQAAAPSVANAVVFYTAVSLYQYDTATRKYVQQGTATSTTVGCVLVGAEVTYSVLLYNADKTTLCEVPLKAWKPTVQPKNYMNFYDERGTNWSLKFPSEDALVEFMRQVFLVKIHTEIWSPTRSLDANALLKEEIGASAIKNNAQDEATKAVGQGDTVGVEFKCWRVVGNAKAPPNDIITKYPPFEKAGEADLRKFRIGDGSERIKALEECVVGMKRGGRRMVLAPPGKTNGQDWYLLDVTLVKTKSGGRRSSERSSAPAAEATPQADSTAPAGEPRKSRRKSSPSSNSNGDIIRVDEDKAKEESDLKERLRQLEFELQQRAFAEGGAGRQAGGLPPNNFTQAAPSAAQYPSMYGGGAGAAGLGVNGGFSPYGSMYQPSQAQQGMMMASGRPVDTMIMELHAKIDYLIRMAPTSGAGGSGSSNFGGPVGATDVQFVLRGVERLAGENERLLLQINSQTQQYSAYERRVEELLKHNQRLQEEKRVADEKYQSMASLQLNYNAEISSLTNAKDAAITQTNRLHAEYQQLLTAYYQKQQSSNESEEQRNALEFERQARARAEKELQREALTRSVAEQELTLAKKQLDVFTKRKDAETQALRNDFEQQLQATKTTQQQEIDDRVKKITTEYQQQETRLQQEWTAQMDRQATQFQAQIDTLQRQVADESHTKQELMEALETAQGQVRELEQRLATHETSMANDDAAVGLEEEEKRIYTAQIDLLQQQVKDLEAEKFERIQRDLSSGRLGSPTSSPRGGDKKNGFSGDDENVVAVLAEAEQRLAAAQAKEESANRTLALAQEIKHEAETMMASAPQGNVAVAGGDPREKAVALFKEGINEIFFRFQDVFEDESHAATPLEPKQVLTVIRKVLKQSTKDVVQRLQEEEPMASVPVPAPAPAPRMSQTLPTVVEEPAPSKFTLAVPLAFGVAAAAVGAAAAVDAGNESDASNDEPPPPPELQPVPEQHPEELEAKPAPAKSKAAAEEKKDEAKEDDNAAGDDLLFGAASTGGGNSSALPITGQFAHAVETDDDSDDDFED